MSTTTLILNADEPLSRAAVRAVGQALEDAALEHLGRDLGTVHRDDIARAAIWATITALSRMNPEGDDGDDPLADDVVFEVDDFNPKTGHLHCCGLPSTGPCECSPALYETAKRLRDELCSWRGVARQMNQKMLALQDLAAGWNSEPPGDIARSYAAERVLAIVNARRPYPL